ncbi:Omega-3 fatty acid desaturase [Streptomyces antibioticus]|nr:fatty acid desaturase [Streptomyces antibioticus]KUN18763.1 Omega-3 fatty acid desaturase [Streptomyces antibioticus]
MTRKSHRGGLDRAVLTRLSKADPLRVTVRAVVVLSTYAGVTVLALQPAVGWGAFVCSAFLGFVLGGFINAAHDCVHRAHLRSRRGNRIAGALWSTPILLNFTSYRHQHLIHHRFTGVEGDTEPPEIFLTVRAYLHSLSGVPFWPGTVRGILRGWQRRFPAGVSTAERRREAAQDNAGLSVWIVLTAGLTVHAPHAMVVAYWLPLVFSFPAMFLLSLPEHYGLWGVPEVARNTRTVRTNRFLRFFIWNANYHAEHHRYPAVASVHLHRLHLALPEPHPIQQRSYLEFHAGLLRALARGRSDYGRLTAASAPERETT